MRIRPNGSFTWSSLEKEAFATRMARLRSCPETRSFSGQTNRINLATRVKEDFIYYVIADNPIGESTYYPDSGKWKVNKSSAEDRVVIKGEETDYFDGEE